MRKESTFNQGFDENLICRSLEFFASQKIGMTGFKGLIGRSLDACLCKRGMTNKKSYQLGGMTFLFCLLSGVTHAQCVPAPDCGELGYTETSCEGDSLKCPFDISKLYCIPCDSVYQYSCTNAGEIGKGNSCNGKYIECGCADGYEVDGTGCKLSCASSYQYTCTGANETGGIGADCYGEYKSCTCADGYGWRNGACEECVSSCTVGSILYSDGSCNSCVISGKTAIGVVVKDNELVMSQSSSDNMKWGTYGADINVLSNYTSAADAKTDYNGKSNTATIIAQDSEAEAAKYCNNYTTAGTSAGDWYLPSAGELYSYVNNNYTTLYATIKMMASIGWNWSNTFWSSSEIGDSSVWVVYTTGPSMYEMYSEAKNRSAERCTCFLDISGY